MKKTEWLELFASSGAFCTKTGRIVSLPQLLKEWGWFETLFLDDVLAALYMGSFMFFPFLVFVGAM